MSGTMETPFPQIVAVRQKPAFLRELVKLEPYPLSLAKGHMATVVPISIPKHMLTSRFPQHHFPRPATHSPAAPLLPLCSLVCPHCPHLSPSLNPLSVAALLLLLLWPGPVCWPSAVHDFLCSGLFQMSLAVLSLRSTIKTFPLTIPWSGHISLQDQQIPGTLCLHFLGTGMQACAPCLAFHSGSRSLDSGLPE